MKMSRLFYLFILSILSLNYPTMSWDYQLFISN